MGKKKKIIIILSVILSLLIIIGVAVGTYFYVKNKNKSSDYSDILITPGNANADGTINTAEMSAYDKYLNTDMEIAEGEDDIIDGKIESIPVSLSDSDTNSFKQYLSSVNVDYDYEEYYNIPESLERCKKTPQKATTHTHDVRVNGQLDGEELYKIVKENNDNYLASDDVVNYEKYSNGDLKKICNALAKHLPLIHEKFPETDMDELCCWLSDLKILNAILTFDHAFVSYDGVFSINEQNIESHKGFMDTDKPYETVFFHELMHMFQMSCSDNKTENEVRMGISHLYEDMTGNGLSWTWLLEASAEKCMSLYMNEKPNTYFFKIDYLNTLSYLSILNPNYKDGQTNMLTFKRDPQLLYDQLGAESEEEINEIIKMMCSIEIYQGEKSNFYDSYKEKTGKDFIPIDQQANEIEDHLFLSVKQDAMMTATKIFYKNLANAIYNGNVTENDVFYLLRIFEANLDMRFSNHNVKYLILSEDFYPQYLNIQNEFFKYLANSNSQSAEYYSDKFENYSMRIKDGTTTKSPNCDLAFLTEDKKQFIADFASGIYKKGSPSMLQCSKDVVTVKEKLESLKS